MDETILFPSPNWFQVSGLAVSNDGWLAYGGPSKSLCILRPLPVDANGVVEGTQYTAHVLNRAHPDKIVSVDISPEWPNKRLVLTGSASGSVKQWSLEEADNSLKFKSTLSHDLHSQEKEEIVGVAYSNEEYAITVGAYGNIVKWNLNSNIVKTYSNILKTFKPSCMACSHHVTLTVAIGTKQGVLFVVDLSGGGNVLYKVRGQDDEIMNVSWCPQFEVQVEKSLDDKRTNQPKPKKSSASDRMEKIRNQKDPDVKNTSAVKKSLPEDSFDDFEVVSEDDMFDIYKDHEADEFGHKKYEPEDIIVKIKEPVEETDYLAECMKLKQTILQKKNEPEPSIESLVDAMDKTTISSEPSTSATGEKDKSKGSEVNKEDAENAVPSSKMEDQDEVKEDSVSSMHVQKHLLAAVGKQGSVRIWSKSGKLVASCALSGGKHPQNRSRYSWASLTWCQPDLLLIADGKNQLLECNPLKIDCKNKLETKLIHSVHKRGLHCVASNAARRPAPAKPSVWTVAQDRTIAHYSILDRTTVVYNTCGGFIYNIQTCPYDASKVAVSVGDGAVRVWTADESDLTDGMLTGSRVVTYWQHVQGKVLTVAWHPTKENLLAFGTAESRVGLIDAGGNEKPARTLPTGLAGGVYALDWCKSKLYAAAKGDLVAYTLERVDEPGMPVSVRLEGAEWSVSTVRARDWLLAVGSDSGGVAVLKVEDYSMLAAAFPFRLDNNVLYLVPAGASENSHFADTYGPKVLGAHSSLGAFIRTMRALRAARRGQHSGVVAVLKEEGYSMPTAASSFSKMIHTIEWHPLQTSFSTDESKYKNLLAACSQDKANTIVILEFGEGEKIAERLNVWKTLSGHTGTVLQVAWSPHHEEKLLSTSHDGTVRVWDVAAGTCVSIFAGHGCTTLGAAWSARPALADVVLSGGTDCCLRLWRAARHPADAYVEIKEEPKKTKKTNKNKEKKAEANEVTEDTANSDENAVAVTQEGKIKRSKKFLLPTITRQMAKPKMTGIRRMLHLYKVKKGIATAKEPEGYDLDYVKMFGTMNDVNELFDMEMEQHLNFGNNEAWIVLAVFRGHIDDMMQFAAEKNLLCPYLLSIAPGVSSKYWKDTSRLYLAQIDRLVASGEEDKLCASRQYGGPVYRKAMTLLSLQDTKSAVRSLLEAKFYKEAYVLCRIRYMDGIADEVLDLWAKHCLHSGQFDMAAICHLALGNLLEAATVLSKSTDEETLALAAELAQAAGQTILADNLLERTNFTLGLTGLDVAIAAEMIQLPSRVDLAVNEMNGRVDEATNDATNG